MDEPNGHIDKVTWYDQQPDGTLVPQRSDYVRKPQHPRRTLRGYRERRMLRGAGEAARQTLVEITETTKDRAEQIQDLGDFRRSLRPHDQYEAEWLIEAMDDAHEAHGEVIMGLSAALNMRMQKWADR
jgi:hypothetical protein